ncbi:MAG: mechanosensitive ion channel [Paludibacteraceae bacterium]|nr:mechanosensitive ion channel [Paludibacteraceae bacterium]
MNDFLSYRIYNNEVQEILISLAFILGAIVLGRLVRWFAEKILPKLTAKTETQLDDVLVEVLKAPMLFALTLVGFWIGIKRLSMPVNVMAMIADIYKFLLVISATWFISRAVSTFINVILKEKVNDESSKMDEHALSLIKKVSSFVIWSIGVITALNNAGVDVGALIAGLGIGGVAIALAAQDTAKNIFAGIMILFDRPFKIGELITIDGTTGYVEDMGIRSTKLRTYSGQLVVIPNYKTADSNLTNITREPSRRIELNVGLTYSTTPEQMRQAMDILRKLPSSVGGIEDKVKVYFTSFGDFSLNITCWYYIKKDSDLFETQSAVNLHVLDEFNAHGLDFAFPTQTLYVNK